MEFVDELKQSSKQGIFLERTVNNLFKLAGFDTKLHKIITFGEVQREIDVYAERDNKVVIVECKFKGDEREVGFEIDVIDSFIGKFKDVIKADNGLIVTNGNVRKQYKKYAHDRNVFIWDGEDLNEIMTKIAENKSDAYNIVMENLTTKKGLTKSYSGSIELLSNLIPIEIDDPHKITHDYISNSQNLELHKATLEVKPFLVVRYSLFFQRKKPGTGELLVEIDKPNEYVILDASNSKIIFDSGSGYIFGDESTSLFVKELQEKFELAEDARIKGKDFDILSIPNRIDEDSVRNSVKTFIISRNEKSYDYETLRGEVRELSVKPDFSNVHINSLSYVNFPVWDVSFKANKKLYKTSVIATNGNVVSDELKKCTFCKNDTESLCEICGNTSCNEHSGKCKICNLITCKDCSIKCVDCNKLVCKNDLKSNGEYCRICKGFVCKDCNIKCIRCKSNICSNHIVSCKVCSKPVCVDCTVQKRFG